MQKIQKIIVFALMFLIGGCEKESSHFQKNLDIIVSIKPLFGLIAKVIEGTPHSLSLLFDGKTSPHTTGLTIKEAARLKQCTLFFWIGPAYETGLIRHTDSLDQSVDLSKTPDLALLPMRTFAAQCHHDECHDHDHGIDGHYWMNIKNAIAMVRFIAKKLSILCPDEKGMFEKNAQKACEDLMLWQEKWQKACPSDELSYVTSHDFAQYLEDLLNIRCVGSLTGEHHGKTLNQAITRSKIDFIIAEPHTRIDSYDRHKTPVIILDYLGENITPTKDVYEKIITTMVERVREYTDDKGMLELTKS